MRRNGPRSMVWYDYFKRITGRSLVCASAACALCLFLSCETAPAHPQWKAPALKNLVLHRLDDDHFRKTAVSVLPLVNSTGEAKLDGTDRFLAALLEKGGRPGAVINSVEVSGVLARQPGLTEEYGRLAVGYARNGIGLEELVALLKRAGISGYAVFTHCTSFKKTSGQYLNKDYDYAARKTKTEKVYVNTIVLSGRLSVIDLDRGLTAFDAFHEVSLSETASDPQNSFSDICCWSILPAKPKDPKTDGLINKFYLEIVSNFPSRDKQDVPRGTK